MCRHLSSAKLTAACVVLVAACASPASADPLTIARGFFSVGGSFWGDLVFNTPDIGPDAPAGFAGEGNGRAPAGLAEFFRSPPNTLPALHAVFSPADVMDPTTNSSCPGCGYGGDLTFFTGPLAIPAVGESMLAPFRMSGTFDGFAPGTGARVFHFDVTGSGTARVSRDFIGFDFGTPGAPTPEPASSLLLISGIAIVARRVRRRSSR